MEPNLLAMHYAQMRVRDQFSEADKRSRVPRPPRPPSRTRQATARLLVRVAARLADEPLPLPSRAQAR
jgi:hypothetical protein